MASTHSRRGAAAFLAVALLVLAVPVPAQAVQDPIELPAGQACDFAVRIDSTTPERTRTFTRTDAAGNLRTLTAGRGAALTITNADSGEALSLPSKGFTTKTTHAADGSYTVKNAGAVLIILFPGDVPAGPSTTLYNGRVTYTVSPAGVWTIVETTGPTRDICAELE